MFIQLSLAYNIWKHINIIFLVRLNLVLVFLLNFRRMTLTNSLRYLWGLGRFIDYLHLPSSLKYVRFGASLIINSVMHLHCFNLLSLEGQIPACVV